MVCNVTVARDTNCTDNIKCHFGNFCGNGTCRAFGSIPSGSLFTVQDNELAPLQTADNSMVASRLCNTFVAIKSEKVTNLPLYQCIDGYEKGFDSYSSAEARQCNYTANFGNGTKGTTGAILAPSICGYNRDNKMYCPMKRSVKEHSSENSNAARTWLDAPTTCHVRSSVQYCKDIEGNDLRSIAFRATMQTDWRTVGENFPLVANSDRCIGNAVAATRAYWRIVDSATGTVLSYFGLIASLFVLTLAY